MLKIKPNGILKGGTISIEYNPVSEIVQISGIAKIGVSIFTKNVPFSANKKIDKYLMQSTAFWIGRKEKIEDVDIEVVSNQGDYAIVTFKHENSDSGTLEVSLKEEYVSVLRITAKSMYAGQQIIVEAVTI